MTEDPRLTLLLALADDELVIGHRHAHWTGVAPHLEEDLAFSSIAQDEIGHAVVWYSLAAQVAGEDGLETLVPHASGSKEPVDALALGRQPDAYRNAIIVERENRGWGYTLARHYLYDTAEDVRLRTLADSSWKAAANATGALLREERYHLMHARTWLERLAKGPVEARRRLTDGLVAAFPEALGLFEPLPGEDALVADGVLPRGHAEQMQEWLDIVARDLADLELERILEEGTGTPADEDQPSGADAMTFVPTSSGAQFRSDRKGRLAAPVVSREGQRWVPSGAFTGQGGRHGKHSEDFAAVWEEMTGTFRAYPTLRW